MVWKGKLMKVRLFDGLVLAMLWAGSTMAFAYDVEVHKKISQRAFNDAIGVHDFLGDVGIDPAQKFGDKTPEDWVIDGSSTEDDGFRSRNHFFDPVNNAGLYGTFTPARDWATNGIDNLGFANDYSIPQARQYLYKALTAPGVAERDQAWANTFRSVGQFTHLLQDMAQPQHVRNDIHISFSEDLNWLTSGYSRYELYTNKNAGALNYAGSYPVVLQPSYREYWQAKGKGLAEFTNANFVSEGTNLDFNPYPGPVVTNTYTYEEVEPQVTDLLDGVTYNNVTVRYVGNTFTDAYTGGAVNNDYLSAFSVFDFVHEQYSPNGVYSLTDKNHQKYADLLIPRAVGYSAGLINYFFRGKLDFDVEPNIASSIIIKNLGAEDVGGMFSLYYDDTSGMRNPVPGASWSLAIPANGQSSPLNFTAPTAPAPMEDGRYLLAFKGDMGQEAQTAVAGKLKCAMLQGKDSVDVKVGPVVTEAQFNALAPIPDAITTTCAYTKKITTRYSLGKVVTPYKPEVPAVPGTPPVYAVRLQIFASLLNDGPVVQTGAYDATEDAISEANRLAAALIPYPVPLSANTLVAASFEAAGAEALKVGYWEDNPVYVSVGKFVLKVQVSVIQNSPAGPTETVENLVGAPTFPKIMDVMLVKAGIPTVHGSPAVPASYELITTKTTSYSPI